jgi:hypothetical protein
VALVTVARPETHRLRLWLLVVDAEGGVGDGAIIFFFSVGAVVVVVELFADETAAVAADEVAVVESSINPAENRVRTENE